MLDVATKKKPKPVKKPSYHHGDLRRALVEETISVLEADGAADFSLRDLARRLGVSHGAPSHHFKDKAALMDAIATEGFRGLADALVEAQSLPVSPAERLAASGVAYVKFAVSHRAHVRTMFGKSPSDQPSEACVAESVRAYATLVSLTRDALGPGASEADVRTVTFASWSSVHGLALLWLEGEGPVRFTSGGTEEGLLALATDVSRFLSIAASRVGHGLTSAT